MVKVGPKLVINFLKLLTGKEIGDLRRGCTTTCLKAAGAQPGLRNELIGSTTLGPMLLKTSRDKKKHCQECSEKASGA